MKTILTLIILALVGAVFYLYTQLQELKQTIKKDEPKVTINIQKKEQRKTPQTTYHDKNKSLQDLDKTIKKDFQQIFHDIFGNPEVKKQLNEGVNQLNQVMKELQNQVQKMGKDDNFFDKLFQQLGADSFKKFEDKKDFYELNIDLHHDKNAKVDINSKNGILSINITSKVEQKTNNQVITKQSQKSYVVQIPDDAMIDMIKSTYHDGVLTITVPKKKDEKKI